MISTSHTEDLFLPFTSDSHVIEELRTYTQNRFQHTPQAWEQAKIREDEPQVPVWKSYLEEVDALGGVYNMLKKYILPFQFPIAAGISQSKAYKSAALKGISTAHMPEATGLLLQEPDRLELKIFDSIGGRVPVLIVPHPEDFQTVIQALAFKNEPRSIPPSMGAGMMSGLTNWNRIHQLKQAWSIQSPTGSWALHFKSHILPQKALYQDRIIVLSTKPYSGINGDAWSYSQEDWKKISLDIRLMHECTHYFTLRFLGGMYINMHDELLADYMGICYATGEFREDLCLAFWGLDEPTYRKGGRLENYLGKSPFSEAAFLALQNILRAAVKQVRNFHVQLRQKESTPSPAIELMALSSVSLAELSADTGAKQLLASYQYWKNLPNSTK